jgi:hypothetical protein
MRRLLGRRRLPRLLLLRVFRLLPGLSLLIGCARLPDRLPQLLMPRLLLHAGGSANLQRRGLHAMLAQQAGSVFDSSVEWERISLGQGVGESQPWPAVSM